MPASPDHCLAIPYIVSSQPEPSYTFQFSPITIKKLIYEEARCKLRYFVQSSLRSRSRCIGIATLLLQPNYPHTTPPFNEICQILEIKLFASHISPVKCIATESAFLAKPPNIARYEWVMSIYCLINCGGLMTALGQGVGGM